MYYLTDFKHFVSIFPSFSIQLTPFSINLKNLTPHFYKSLDLIGSIFFSCGNPDSVYTAYMTMSLSNGFLLLLKYWERKLNYKPGLP